MNLSQRYLTRKKVHIIMDIFHKRIKLTEVVVASAVALASVVVASTMPRDTRTLCWVVASGL